MKNNLPYVANCDSFHRPRNDIKLVTLWNIFLLYSLNPNVYKNTSFHWTFNNESNITLHLLFPFLPPMPFLCTYFLNPGQVGNPEPSCQPHSLTTYHVHNEARKPELCSPVQLSPILTTQPISTVHTWSFLYMPTRLAQPTTCTSLDSRTLTLQEINRKMRLTKPCLMPSTSHQN